FDSGLGHQATHLSSPRNVTSRWPVSCRRTCFLPDLRRRLPVFASKTGLDISFPIMKLIAAKFSKINKAQRNYWNFGGFPSAFEHNKYMEPSKILPQE
ncbi:MAG TPA: hypothetical protein VEC01_13020, partial [Noviherbaspirillum sp.]|uniref:hypothetical protein n=1 Tax=Noviherbaspirillum sp. TaxID=1926288 RepID=UPI002D2461C1